jgi:excisionase family DNA binding protein
MTQQAAPLPSRRKAPPPVLITAQEAARRLSVGVRTIWRLVELKRLPEPVRFSRKLVRFHAPDLDAYLSDLARRQAARGW